MATADLRLVGEQECGLRHPEEPLQEGEVDDGREGGEVEVGAQVDEADAGGAAADEQRGAEGVDEVDEEDVGRVAVERPLVRDGERVAARQHGQQQDEHVHACGNYNSVVSASYGRGRTVYVYST